MGTDAHRSDLPRLSDLLAGWRTTWSGRDLFTVTAGRHWVRLHLEGPERAGILMTEITGARLVCHVTGRLPAPLGEALPPDKRHPLRDLLKSCRLDGLGMLPADRVAAFRLVRPDGSHLVLLHRLFGARGNTVLLDAGDKVLWARHRPPHELLSRIPPSATWDTGVPGEDDLSAAALEQLALQLGNARAVTMTAALDRRHRTARRLAENLTRDLANAEQGGELRRRAEALAASLHTIGHGDGEARITDPRDGTPLVLELNPALTAAANLEAWFRRARKAERGREIIADRLDAAHVDVQQCVAASTRLETAVEVTDHLDRLAALDSWRRDHDALLPAAAPARGRHHPDQPARSFRRYLVDDRWEVWVGRSGAENDELTHRASHSKDLWFHAQGVSGSHVVLRTGGNPERVPRGAIEKAARLAALHSKSRHSGLVPVIWTERRYVRRPRKAPAGTAVCLREQSMMVEPGVAVGVQTI
ncbi:hypothetical protein DRQ50_07270 [bacterium]|nr:MAG: hypothetical protein DRQ50_07270 [bacterium]